MTIISETNQSHTYGQEATKQKSQPWEFFLDYRGMSYETNVLCSLFFPICHYYQSNI